MKILIVGGAVRDLALGRPINDIDYLVQGTTIDEFLQVFPDAQQVGRDFPVSLINGEEYAFARTEFSTGRGHTHFSVNANETISILEDLDRRDLTVNAIAMCPETGELVCRAQSQSDLINKVLRHNSEAFCEDPLRVYRVARFAAQLPDFNVAEETLHLMDTLRHEIYFVPPERVFAELKKALESYAPHRFFEILLESNCLGTHFPELKALLGVAAGPDLGKHRGEVDCFDHTMKVLRETPTEDPALRFAALCHDLGKSLSINPPKHHGHDKAGLPLVDRLCRRLRVPNKWKALAKMFCEQHLRMHKVLEMKPGKAVTLLTNVDKAVGLKNFLTCSIGDGMSSLEAMYILNRFETVKTVKLPEKHQNLGKKSAEILLHLRAEEWKRVN